MRDAVQRRRAAIRAFMELRKLKVLPWCQEAGVAPSTLYSFLKGRSDSLTHGTLEKLAEAANVTLAELVGETVKAANHEVERVEIPSTVLVYELDLQGGLGALGHAEHMNDGGLAAERIANAWHLPRNLFVGRIRGSLNDIRILRVGGNSMLPDYADGDYVFVDTSDKVPSPEGVFAVFDGLGVVIKEVQFKAFSDPPTVRMISTNTRYEPYERTLDEAYIQGRVFGKLAWR